MTRDKAFLRLGLITSAVFCLGYARFSFAEQPIQQVQRTVERVTRVLQDAGVDAKSDRRETAEKIRRILLPSFDFAEMAKRSLGDQWANLGGKQNEFVTVFAPFVENAYMNTLASYRGEKIIYLRERVNQNLAQVDTQIVSENGDPLAVSYRLHLVESEWKVYDVVVDNIGLVSNFHSQFNRILASASVDELLRKLREKGSGKPV